MRKQNKITLCDYLANKVPNECVEVLMDSGYQFEKPRSKEELADLLKQYVSRDRSEEHTSELQSHHDLVCRLLLEKKKHNDTHKNKHTKTTAPAK